LIEADRPLEAAAPWQTCATAAHVPTLPSNTHREYPGSAAVSSNLHVATKFAAYPWRVTPGNIVAACKGSLRRTGLESISLGQLHWSAAKYAPLQEWALWNGLADCYEQGLVSAVGVSNYGAKELVRVARDFEKRGVPLASAQVGGLAPAPHSARQQQGAEHYVSGYNPTVSGSNWAAVSAPPSPLQVQYSLLSCGPAQSSIKAVADDLGIVLIAYSPLALGLLTGGCCGGWVGRRSAHAG
jgi:pyridoxine 4-dehydrogenase